MSVGHKSLKYIEEMMELAGKEIKGSKICLMGHLNTKGCSREYIRKKGVKGFTLISSYLKHMGADAIEIDLNNKQIALKLDLGRVIDDKSLWGTFDIIIDGGTGEHIDNQQAYWENVFNLLKVGGLGIFNLPYRNSWDGHATWRYDIKWLDNFIKSQNYKILDMRKTNDNYFCMSPLRRILSWAMVKTPETICTKIPETIFDPQGNIKDKSMYDRFVLEARKK